MLTIIGGIIAKLKSINNNPRILITDLICIIFTQIDLLFVLYLFYLFITTNELDITSIISLPVFTYNEQVLLAIAKEKIISFIGKLNRAKGYDLFGGAILKILRKHKDWNALVIGDEYTIVEGRYKTINTHLRHFVRYIGPKTKIPDLKNNFLTF